MRSKSVLAVVCAAAVATSLSGCRLSGRVSVNSNSGAESSVNLQSSDPAVSTSLGASESQPDISEPVSEQTSEPVSEPASESVSEPASEPVSAAESKPEDNSPGGAEGIFSGLTFEGIYNDYAKQIDEETEQCINQLNANKSDLDKISDISADGIDKLADLCAEGIDKMADRIDLNTMGYSEWANKLTSKYMAKSQEITSKYMELSMNAAMDDYNSILDDAFGGLDFGF